MADLLLELFSEEIPARMQRTAVEDIHHMLVKALEEARLTHGSIQKFSTPRRIAFIVPGLPASQPDTSVERKGPATNAPAAAIEGFLRSTGLTKEQCEIRLVGKQECYFATIHEKGKPAAEALVPLINKIIAGYTWPKSMRWGAYDQAWVRPLQNICCLLDNTVVPVSFAHISANNKTFGHRFLAPGEIILKSPADYEPALEKAKVIADAEKRKKLIIKNMDTAAASLKLEVVEDAALLEEVTGLVEWPVLLQARIDDAFMDLPPEVLRSEMRNHQKYFNLKKNGAEGIAPEFLLVSNLIASDGGKAIIAGNERVLRARLADGRFYWDQDRKKPLADWATGLTNMVFHAKLGSMAERIERIVKLSLFLEHYVKADKNKLRRAAQLCKADLSTGMVGEFPELQGIMGRYYAMQQNEAPEVANAIRDHYLPLGPQSPCPTEPTAIAVALADKIDTLIGLFATGDRPTGSKDPYALRRAALGVIRIVLENNLRIPLKRLFTQAEIAYAAIKPAADTVDSVLQFFADRLKVMLRDQGHRHDLIEAVFTAEEDDLARVMSRISALSVFLASEDGKNLLAAYKRAANIVRIEEKKDGSSYHAAPDNALSKSQEETDLFAALGALSRDLPELIKDEKYDLAMSALAKLRAPVDAFFDKVTVNAEDSTLRKNRLQLLRQITQLMETVADFGKIEG